MFYYSSSNYSSSYGYVQNRPDPREKQEVEEANEAGALLDQETSFVQATPPPVQTRDYNAVVLGGSGGNPAGQPTSGNSVASNPAPFVVPPQERTGAGAMVVREMQGLVNLAQTLTDPVAPWKCLGIMVGAGFLKSPGGCGPPTKIIPKMTQS